MTRRAGSPPTILPWTLLLLALAAVGISVILIPFPWGFLPCLGFLLVLACARRPTLGLSVMIPFLPNYGLDVFHIYGTMDLSLLEPVVTLAGVSWVMFFVGGKGRRLVFSQSDAGLFLLFGWALLSVLWTPAAFRSIQQVLKILIGFSIYFLMVNLIRDEDDFDLVVWSWILLALVVSVVGVYQVLTEGFHAAESYQFTSGYDKIHRDVRTTALFRGADMVGFLLSLCIVIAVTKYAVAASRVRAVLAILLPLFLFVFITAMSRKSFLALALALFLLSIASPAVLRLCIAGAVLTIVGVLLTISTGFTTALLERVGSLVMSPEEAMSNRLGTWLVAYEFFLRSPLIGNGIGSFFAFAVQQDSPLQFEHNFYLFLLVELGVAGFTLFLFWALLIARRLLEFYRRNHDEKGRVVCAGMFAGMVAIAVTMFFRSFSLTDPTFWGFMGLTSAALHVYSKRAGRPAVEEPESVQEEPALIAMTS
jgi:O-antigen ligase